MASNTMKTILLKGDLGKLYEEARANGAITPGHIIETDANGEVKVHATAAGAWGGAVAIEDALQGPDLVNTQGNTINDAYPDDALVRYIQLQSGEVWNAILTTSQTIAKGGGLESAGNGRLRALAAGVLIAYAEEAVTTTGATARIAARKI